MITKILSVLLIVLFSLPALAMDEAQLENINYSFGYFLGKDLKKANLEYRIDQMLDGLYDGAEGLGSKYSAEETQANLAIKKTEDEDLLQRANYSHGFRAGTLIKSLEIDFQPEPFLYGATDVIDKKKLRLSKKKMTELINKLKKPEEG